jgi:hypothetical protein
MQIITPAVAQAKTLITSSEAAKEMGRWDAERGCRCQSDAYAYADEWQAPYWQADYTFAFMTAKGL